MAINESVQYVCMNVCMVTHIVRVWINRVRPTLMETKNLYENGPNPFLFCFFQSYGNENGPDSYSQNPFERFVTSLQTDLVPRFVCISDIKLQTDFARGATITTFGQ